ncbi:hypothetical protein WJX72_006674 [[Myrmecia] bisecta]|uniref:Ku domain-containing protein n=1 Tax=[Myrmecia] bisecta TaxID=41462 RepID=A0AAW1Q2D2_9CHLO
MANKELAVVVLDVGPAMHKVPGLLENAGKALAGYIQSKILLSKAHEVALLYFGTTGTSNPVHQEMADQAEQAGEEDPNMYAHITLQRPMRPPDIDYLKDLADLPSGNGSSDFLDALTVAVDTIYRTVQERPAMDKDTVKKRIVLLTNFLSPSAPDPDNSFAGMLVQKMQDKRISLDIYSVDEPSCDREPRLAKIKAQNNDTLDQIRPQVRHTEKSIRRPLDLLSAFKAKEYSATAYFSGSLDIGQHMHIRVKVCKKTSQEKAPTTSKYSTKSQAAGAKHEVELDREYRSESHPDMILTPTDLTKGYRYGKQVVPMAEENEKFLTYTPERCMQLVGFMPRDKVQRHLFTKDCWVVVAEKDNERAHLALSALVRALAAKRFGAVVRFVPRANSPVIMGYATPLLGGNNNPDCLVLNHLPFMQDIRAYAFGSFSKPEVQPTAAQRVVAGKLVKALCLINGKSELLAPNEVVNPYIHRFNRFIGEKAVNPETQVSEEDPLAKRILEPPLEELPKAAAELLQALPDTFEVKVQVPKKEEQAAGLETGPSLPTEEGPAAPHDDDMFDLNEAPATQVESVGTSNPQGDFASLLGRGRVDAAVRGMQTAVTSLVDSSLGDRLYNKARDCLPPLREACIQHGQPKAFNDFLHKLAADYEHSRLRADFWKRVHTAGVTLISEDEAAGAGVSKSEALDFLRQHGPAAQAVEVKPPEPMEEEEDEFAGME